jgi:RNA polymerase sigma-70 factor (ECF subfamily)
VSASFAGIGRLEPVTAGERAGAIRLVFQAGLTKLASVVAEEINWPEALRGPDNAASLAGLRAMLLNGLRVALRDRAEVNDAHLEDFAQDALLKVLERLDQFSGRSKFTTWAHAIAVNVAFAELRRKRWRDVSLDALVADGRELTEPATLAPDTATGDEERTRIIGALRTAMAERLSDKQRAAIAGLLEGLPFNQIVDLLGTNRNAAYKLVYDARRAIKQHLLAEGISSETIRTAFAP